MKFKSSGWRIAALVIAALLILTGIYFLLPYVLSLAGWAVRVFMPFILGYVFSLVINPLADKLQKRFKLPRGISAILVIILTVGIFGGIITGIVWKIISEIRSLYTHYPQIYADAVALWEDISTRFSDIYIKMPDNVQEVLDNLGQQALSSVTAFFNQTPVVERAGNFAKALPGIFIALIVFFLSLYFMITDAKGVSVFLHKIVSEKTLSKLANIRTELKKYMGGYVKAQAIIMSIAFAVVFVGLSILNVNYALLIALGIAVFDALPFFGSGAVLWPWAAVSFLNGSIKTGVGLLIIYLAIVLTRQTIEPKVVSSSIGLHPIMTLMSMYVGYKTFSIGGMILGPITLMLVISFYKAGVFDPIIRFFGKIKNAAIQELYKIKEIFK